MPGNPNQFSIKLPNVPAKNDKEAAENWRQIDQWDRRLAATGRVQITGVTLVQTTASVAWRNLPQNFNTLYIVAAAACTGAAGNNNLQLQLNGDTGLNYYWTVVGTFNNAAPATNSGSGAASILLGNIPGNTGRIGYSSTTIPGYATSGQFRGGITHSSSFETTTNSVQTGGFFWNNTSPISSMLLFPNTGSFRAGTSLYLYGEF